MAVRQSNQMRRSVMLIRSYIVFHARKVDAAVRMPESWLYLMEWARLGGMAKEVPNGWR